MRLRSFAARTYGGSGLTGGGGGGGAGWVAGVAAAEGAGEAPPGTATSPAVVGVAAAAASPGSASPAASRRARERARRCSGTSVIQPHPSARPSGGEPRQPLPRATKTGAARYVSAHESVMREVAK